MTTTTSTATSTATTFDYSKTAAGRFSAASKHVTTAPVVRVFDTLVDEARARGLSVGDAVRDVVYSLHANDVRRLLDRSDAREMSAYMRHIGGVDLGG